MSVINRIRLLLYFLVKKIIGKDFLFDQVVYQLGELETADKKKYVYKFRQSLGKRYFNQTVISSFNDLAPYEKTEVLDCVEGSLGRGFIIDHVTDQLIALDNTDQCLESISVDSKKDFFQAFHSAFGQGYVNYLTIQSRHVLFEQLSDVLADKHVNHLFAKRFSGLNGTEREEAFYHIKVAFGNEYLIQKMIGLLSGLEHDAKLGVLDRIKNNLGVDFVNKQVVASFSVMGGDVKSEMFNLICDALGTQYIQNKMFTAIAALNSAEKTTVCENFGNILNYDYIESVLLERLKSYSKSQKTIFFPRLIASIGEPFFKRQIINGIELFNSGAKEELLDAITDVLGVEFVYKNIRSELIKLSSLNGQNYSAESISAADLSQLMLSDAQQVLDKLPIEAQYTNYKRLLPRYSDVFASQEGEDILIRRLMKKVYNDIGFYVDVGAHDPLRFSTTLHYYLKGWRGINIDPIPGMKQKFDEIRPRDLNVECGVSQHESNMKYYMFEEPAFNTFSDDNYLSAIDKTKLVKTQAVSTKPLRNILNDSLPSQQNITFMTIDVEGLELEVLASSDWDKYRPYLLCVETLSDEHSDRLKRYLSGVDYLKVADTKNSILFVDAKIGHLLD